MPGIVSQIDILKYHAAASRVRGKFLLSTGEISDFWIDINEFVNKRVINAMTLLLSSFIENCYRIHGPFSVIFPSYTEASEKSFPLRLIVDAAVDRLGGSLEVDSIAAVQEQSSGKMAVVSKPKAVCVVVIGVSVHITVLLGIISVLKSMGCKIAYVLTFLCREKTSMSKMKELGIPFVPVLIALEDRGDVFSILDGDKLNDPQYGQLQVLETLITGGDRK